MLKTIDRYVIREVVPPFVLSLLIFTFVLELPPLMGELERLLAKGVPWPTVGRIILLLSPQALGLTIPMSLLVGLLIGFGRLSTDRESVALLACGVSPYRLLRPVLVLAGIATAATLYVMIDAIPDANQKYREILFATLTKKVESDIQPRVFFQEFPNWVLYPRNEAPPGEPGWSDVLLADTSKHEAVELHLARRGRIVLDSAKRTVEVVLANGIKYGTAGPGQSSATRFEQVIIRLDPDSVFPPVDLARGMTEKTIAQLQADIKDKMSRNESTHNEIMAIHAKFSIPMACLVFAVIALALGLRVSRDGKLGGFVVGIGVIFAYYIVMFLAESMAKGHRIPAEYARWVPNLLLGPFGIVALIWRTRHAEGRLPFGLHMPQLRLPAFARRRFQPNDAAPRTAAAAERPRPGRHPADHPASSHAPAEPDRSLHQPSLHARRRPVVSRAPRVVLHLDLHRSLGQGLQGAGNHGDGQLLVLLTPQFIYYVIPIAALLSALVTYGLLARSSELTVMKACGISLYRTALSVVALSLGFSAVLFAFEQRLLARANRRAAVLDDEIRGRPPRPLNPLNRRWVIGCDEHLPLRQLRSRASGAPGLSIYTPRPARGAWRRRPTCTAQYTDEGWIGTNGWMQDLPRAPRLAAVLPRVDHRGVAGLLRDRADRRRHDDRRRVAPLRRRALRQRLRRRRPLGRAAAQTRLSLRHLRDDAPRCPVRRQHRPPGPSTASASASSSRSGTGS